MTPQKGIQVHPDSSLFIQQAHQISRAAYYLSSTQKQILTVLIAQVQIRQNGFELLEVSTGDMMRTLGIEDSHYDFLRDHMRSLKSAVVEIDTEEGWKLHSWVDTIEFVRTRDVFIFKLSPDLLPFILNLKSMWSKIALIDLTKLTGRYTSRIFEMVMAEKGMEGNRGNHPGEWFVDMDFSDLRVRFKIGKNEYKKTNALRAWVIDHSIKEINEANVGLKLAADYDRFRHGRRLSGVRILVKSTLPQDPRNVTPTREELEEEALKDLNKELYEQLLANEPVDVFGGELARQGNAWSKLLSHPDLVPLPKKKSNRAKE